MKCPRCKEDMDYEEIKFPCGYWYCDCGAEYEGERFPCDSDGMVITDHEERLEVWKELETLEIDKNIEFKLGRKVFTLRRKR